MPKCQKCGEMVAPQFTFHIIGHENDPEALECTWCRKNIDFIERKDGTKYRKTDAVKEYKILLKKLSEKKNIAEQLVKGKIKMPGD